MLAAGTPPMHRTFRITCLAAAAASLVALAGAASAQDVRTDTEACTLQGGPTRSVVRVIDSETVLLDDQQEVRLIGAWRRAHRISVRVPSPGRRKKQPSRH